MTCSRAVSDDEQRARDAAAAAAVERIEPGTTIGLGSGRAVWRVIDLIAERGIHVRAAFASEGTRERAETARIDGVMLDGSVRLAMAIDGADEVDPRLGLIKGAGAALLREKIVIAAAERFLVVAEARKKVARLGDTRGLPVEVVRFGWRDTRRRLLDIVDGAERRTGDRGEPVVTDEGHYLLDCDLPGAGDLEPLGAAIKATVGVVEHGLFLGLATEALLGTPEGEVEVLHP
jgi:ribose 5-phosphate isomerase A